MDVRQINDSVFEALFRQAVIDNFYEELDSLPPDEELLTLYTFSPEHEARMKRLFAREERRERIGAVVKWSRRTAAVIVIAATILFGTLMLVPGVRAVVIETITEWYEQFVRFTSNAPETEKTNLEPTYIPEGFGEEMRESTDITEIVLYTNEDGLIIVFQSIRASGSISVDNEIRIYETILLEGNEYHTFTSDDTAGENAVIWDLDNQRYAVTSTIPVGELLKIAKSVG